MSGPLPLLESRRAELLRALANLYDMCPGSVVSRISLWQTELPCALEGIPAGMVTIKAPVGYLESLALMRASDGLLVIDAPADQSVFLHVADDVGELKCQAASDRQVFRRRISIAKYPYANEADDRRHAIAVLR